MAARRILLADDYSDLAESLAELLRFDDHEVRLACDGIEALEVAERFRPEILLLDLAMPKMDGFTVARRIRETRWGKDAVLIAVTGLGQRQVGERCDEAGFNAQFLKPFDYVELSKLLASFECKLTPSGGQAVAGRSSDDHADKFHCRANLSDSISGSRRFLHRFDNAIPAP